MIIPPHEMVRMVVKAGSADGLKIMDAIGDAALALGLSPRWVRSLWRNEPLAITDTRARTIRERYRAWLAATIARQEAIIAEQRAQLAALEAAHVASGKKCREDLDQSGFDPMADGFATVKGGVR